MTPSAPRSASTLAPAGAIAALLLAGLAPIACDPGDGRGGGGLGQMDGDGKFDTDTSSAEYSEEICLDFDEAFCPAGTDACDWDWDADGAYIAQSCTLINADGTYEVDSEGREGLLDQVSLPGESREDGRARKCMILEQARQLCANGSYTPPITTIEVHREGWIGATERNQTRTSSCHPGAEYLCDPIESDYDEIRDASTTTLLGAELVPVAPTYCSGQVVGDRGYATEIPADAMIGRTTDWERDEALDEVAEVGQRLEAYGGSILGMEASTLMNLQNPVRRALIDCVAPNLGEGTPCTLESTTDDLEGDQYAMTGDYCFETVRHRRDIPAGQETCEGNAHCEGRAIDLNNNIEGHLNSGNIVNCVASSDPNCTNEYRAPRVDLPPQFVRVMEGCGFQWLGRDGSTGAVLGSEGGHFGCDPMHFQLELPQ